MNGQIRGGVCSTIDYEKLKIFSAEIEATSAGSVQPGSFHI